MVRIEFNREQKRAIAFDEDTLVGECTFEENDNVWNINHTFVNAKLIPKDDFNLTSREKEVLVLLTHGLSNTEIAEKLIISTHTAKAHVCNILTKLSVTDRVQAAVKATKYDL